MSDADDFVEFADLYADVLTEESGGRGLTWRDMRAWWGWPQFEQLHSGVEDVYVSPRWRL